jgi:hypothetical protein
MKIRNQIFLIVALTFGIGLSIGYLFTTSFNEEILKYERVEKKDDIGDLPDDLIAILDRFTLVNKATNQTLLKFIVLGGVEGTYEEGGEVFETYVLSFEDRFEGAEADNDFLDVIIEFKRVKEENSVTVRMVQLGLDTIDVFLDGGLIDSIRPGIEVQVRA